VSPLIELHLYSLRSKMMRLNIHGIPIDPGIQNPVRDCHPYLARYKPAWAGSVFLANYTGTSRAYDSVRRAYTL
jgi:hypothetical protein